MRRYTLVCDDRQSREISGLAVEYGLTEQEVLRQLLDVGIETVREERTGRGNRGDGGDGDDRLDRLDRIDRAHQID